jgi:Flp pilus assembly protein TadD
VLLSAHGAKMMASRLIAIRQDTVMFNRTKFLAPAAALLAAQLAGCASLPAISIPSAAPVDSTARMAPDRREILRAPPIAQAAFWGEEVRKDPNDREAMERWAENLRLAGNTSLAADVTGPALERWRDNPSLLRTRGLSFIAIGRGDAAIEALSRAVRVSPKDAKLVSALAVAHDVAGDVEEARSLHERARKMAPTEQSVALNQAVSIMMAGDPVAAEGILRPLAERADANASVRQNLALAVGLQGRLSEAERLLLTDAPPAEAEKTLSWLRASNRAVQQTAAGRPTMSPVAVQPAATSAAGVDVAVDQAEPAAAAQTPPDAVSPESKRDTSTFRLRPRIKDG